MNTRIENKIPDISALVRSTDCNIKITEIENKIPNDSDFDTKLRIISSKVTSNKTRQVHSDTKMSP